MRACVLVLLCACGSDARSTSSPPEEVPQTEARDAQVRIERLQKDLAALDEQIAAASQDRVPLLRRDRAQLDQQLAQARKAYCVTEPLPAGCK